MTKKLTIALLIFSLLLFPSTTNAQNINTYSTIAAPSTLSGYLTTDTGEVFEIVGHLVEPVATIAEFSDNTSNEHALTYEYDLRSTQSYQLSSEDTDGSISVRAYLTIYYTQKESSFLLTKVTGKWTILDPRTTVTSAYLNYGCTGSLGTQGGHQYVANNFSVTTNFSKYQPSLSDMIYVGANLTLNLQIAMTRTWSFTLNDVLPF